MKVAVCMYRAKYSQLFRSAVSNGRGFPETSFCFVFYPTEGFCNIVDRYPSRKLVDECPEIP